MLLGYTASNKRYIAVTRHIWGILVEFIFVACDFKVYTPARGRRIKKPKQKFQSFFRCLR